MPCFWPIPTSRWWREKNSNWTRKYVQRWKGSIAIPLANKPEVDLRTEPQSIEISQQPDFNPRFFRRLWITLIKPQWIGKAPQLGLTSPDSIPAGPLSKGSHSDARDLIHLLKSDRPMARWPNVSPFHTSFYFKNIRTLALLLAPSQKQQTCNNLTRKDLTIFGNSCILLPFFQINLRWAESTCISPQKNLDPHLFGMRFTAKDLLWCFTKSTEARDWLGSCNQTSEWGGNHENYGKSMGNSTVKSWENEEIDLL